jgi:hypothetical protein
MRLTPGAYYVHPLNKLHSKVMLQVLPPNKGATILSIITLSTAFK